MNFKQIFSYVLFINVHADVKNSFITDYFKYKKVPNVVGFSCDNAQEDFELFKDFSSSSILLTLNKLSDQSEIHLLANANYWKIGIFLDLRCYDEESIAFLFFEATSYKLFDELRYWLVIGSDLNEALTVIYDDEFGLSTDFVIAISTNTSDFYELYDIYNVYKERGTSINVTFLGYWDYYTGFNISLLEDKFNRRCNMHNLNVKAMFFKRAYRLENKTLIDYFNDYAHATRDGQSKYGYHILNHLADLYNFSLEVIESVQWEAGDPLGPIARALMNNSADLTGTPLSINSQRTYLMKFVRQGWPFRTCFMFRNPQPRNIKTQEIFRPLSRTTWYLMFLILALSALLLTIVFRFEQKHDRNITRVSNSFLLTIGALCQQCTNMQMVQISTRITFFFVMLYSLLMYDYYSASVVSARLDEPVMKINDSLIQFAKLTMKMSSEWMIYFDFFMKKTDWEMSTFYHNYWLKLPESDRFIEPSLGMSLVQKGGFAYHTHPQVGYQHIERYYNNREICEIMEVHVARPIITAFAIKWNSTILELPRVGLTKISEVGLSRRQVLRWQYRKPPCRKDILSASSVTMYEFAPHLILLFMGVIMAAGLLVLEMVVSKRLYKFRLKFKFIRRPKKLFERRRIRTRFKQLLDLFP